jgi:hypothetical protein
MRAGCAAIASLRNTLSRRQSSAPLVRSGGSGGLRFTEPGAANGSASSRVTPGSRVQAKGSLWGPVLRKATLKRAIAQFVKTSFSILRRLDEFF